MLQLWLTLDDPQGGAAALPPACPHAACGQAGVRRFQTVAKPVRGLGAHGVTAERYRCLACRRTFRVYPAGIDRGHVPAAVKHLAAGLHGLGLSYRDISRALAVLGVALGKSTVQVLAAPLAGAGPPRPGWLGAVLERVELEPGGAGASDGGDGRDGEGGCGISRLASRGAAARGDGPRAWVWIGGRRHALRRAVDARGRTALVVDGVARDLGYIVDVWAGAMLAAHGVQAAVVYAGDAGRQRWGPVWGSLGGAMPCGAGPICWPGVAGGGAPWDGGEGMVAAAAAGAPAMLEPPPRQPEIGTDGAAAGALWPGPGQAAPPMHPAPPARPIPPAVPRRSPGGDRSSRCGRPRWRAETTGVSSGSAADRWLGVRLPTSGDGSVERPSLHIRAVHFGRPLRHRRPPEVHRRCA